MCGTFGLTNPIHARAHPLAIGFLFPNGIHEISREKKLYFRKCRSNQAVWYNRKGKQFVFFAYEIHVKPKQMFA